MRSSLLRFARASVARGIAVGGVAGLAALPVAAGATPALTVDVATGDVLYQQEATRPWFPASTTKLMTVYVALSAVRDHRIAMDTPLVYSARAQAMPPSKMGFRPGTQVTLENALRMLMVRSANDIAITVAEGVSGSVEAFADDMNQAAAELGLRESHFVNPNGLPAAGHVSSARDMALIARALYASFPEQAGLFNLGALQLGPEVITNHNNMLGRYPGADGMKTGFTCSAGFNVVASAYRDGRRIVTVVMGAPSVALRTAKAAALFDRAFANVDRPNGSIVALPSSGGGAPDMRNEVCRARGHLIAQYNEEVEQLDAPLLAGASSGSSGGLGLSALNPAGGFLFGNQPAPSAMPVTPTALRINAMPRPVFEPIAVHVGAEPGYQGVVAQARAPHSPAGTEPVPAAVEAYAAVPAGGPVQGVGVTPLTTDPDALPMRGRRVRAAHGRAGRAAALKAAAEAPKTKVLASGEGDDAAKPREAGRKAAAAKPRKEALKKHAGDAKPAGEAKPTGAKPAKKANAADDG